MAKFDPEQGRSIFEHRRRSSATSRISKMRERRAGSKYVMLSVVESIELFAKIRNGKVWSGTRPQYF